MNQISSFPMFVAKVVYIVTQISCQGNGLILMLVYHETLRVKEEGGEERHKEVKE